uniref:Uncharacterized protein n=1 Tax=Ditylenchus dipsaci TaxID=166011 RepID=A0A915CXW7_9BILA
MVHASNPGSCMLFSKRVPNAGPRRQRRCRIAAYPNSSPPTTRDLSPIWNNSSKDAEQVPELLSHILTCTIWKRSMHTSHQDREANISHCDVEMCFRSNSQPQNSLPDGGGYVSAYAAYQNGCPLNSMFY